MTNAIECRGIGKTYPRFTLNEIDLDVPEGSVMGFVGPNGAGKSTTLRIIMGLVHADLGTVSVLGHPMPREQIAAKWDVGFFSEDMRLHPGETLEFHMLLMASIFESWDETYAARLLQRFELDSTQRVKGLSHGQRVKAGLLMVLARHPRLLVLDEPTTGLDPLARRQILDEMSEVLADESRSILFSSHNTLDVEQLSDRITFISNGAIVFSQDKETLLDSWRRIRLQVSEDFTIPPTEGVVDVQRTGHLAVVTTNAYCEGGQAAFTSAGASITAVERLTLEEIFLTSVSGSQSQEVSS